jgi:hypothetical protein
MCQLGTNIRFPVKPAYMAETGATARNSEVSGAFPTHQEDLGSGHTHLFARIIESNEKQL